MKSRYRRAYTVAGIVLAAVIVLLALTGCSQAPPFVSTPLPAIPAECRGPWPSEPKLPDADVRRSVGARDRDALKTALRTERRYRRTCLERLEAVLPEDATS